MAFFRTTPPAVEPVSLSDMKAYLRVAHDADNTLISTLVSAARGSIEARTGRAMITQGWRVVLDAWPADGIVAVPVAPVATVDLVAVLDAGGAPVTVDAQLVSADLSGAPARVRVASPRPTPGVALGGVRLEGNAGYGAAPEDVPEALALAVRLLVAAWYERRDQVGGEAVPAAALALLEPFRAVRL